MSGGEPSPGTVTTIVHSDTEAYMVFDFNDPKIATVNAVRDVLINSDINLPENSSWETIQIFIKHEGTGIDVVLTDRYLHKVHPWQNNSLAPKTVELTVKDKPLKLQASLQLVAPPDMTQNNVQQTLNLFMPEEWNQLLEDIDPKDVVNILNESLLSQDQLDDGASLTGTDPAGETADSRIAAFHRLRSTSGELQEGPKGPPLEFIDDLRKDQRLQYSSDFRSAVMLQGRKSIPQNVEHPSLQIPDAYVERIEAGVPMKLIVAVVEGRPIHEKARCCLAPHRGLLPNSREKFSKAKEFYNPFIWPIQKEQLTKIDDEKQNKITVMTLNLHLFQSKDVTHDYNPTPVPFDKNFELKEVHPVPFRVEIPSNQTTTTSHRKRPSNAFHESPLRIKCLLQTNDNGLDWNTCCESNIFFTKQRKGEEQKSTNRSLPQQQCQGKKRKRESSSSRQ
ncbi:unnamed protein product [Adineta ricciae]|uniref:Uncharacterized protein n=1 Tax=Adineta ricciae TaxID=249248 RepID=A0A814TTJ9_ADIRI|nr:unnamed protein product [Adineta ricciae]CAF1305476.1 unnamed protein product [Adineta ricciae]